MYVDGVEVARQVASASNANPWNQNYPLRLGNEAVGGRGWKGTYYLVAFYDRALAPRKWHRTIMSGHSLQLPVSAVGG
jgi:hypothetical protein